MLYYILHFDFDYELLISFQLHYESIQSQLPLIRVKAPLKTQISRLQFLYNSHLLKKEMSSLGIQRVPIYGQEALKHGIWHTDYGIHKQKDVAQQAIADVVNMVFPFVK